MNPIFLDTSYFIALFLSKDSAHAQAVEFSATNDKPLITTSAIILELGARFSDVISRGAFLRTLQILKEECVEIVHVDPFLQTRGIELFQRRIDKNWSLADCISFVLMTDREITHAATTDEHCEQSGFVALLRTQPACGN